MPLVGVSCDQTLRDAIFSEEVYKFGEMLFELTFHRILQPRECDLPYLVSCLSKNKPQSFFGRLRLIYTASDPSHGLIWACLRKTITLQDLLECDYVREGLANLDGTDFVKVARDLAACRQTGH